METPSKKEGEINYRLVVFDTETTGLSGTDEIIELSCCVCDNEGSPLHTEEESFSSFVFTTKKIHPRAAATHGIDNEKLKNQPPFKVAIKNMFDWTRRYVDDTQTVVLVAYNGDVFDFRFLVRQLKKDKLELPANWTRTLDPLQVIKTTKCLTRDRPANASNSLGKVFEFIAGKPLSNAHSAKGDVIGLAAICRDARIKVHFKKFLKPWLAFADNVSDEKKEVSSPIPVSSAPTAAPSPILTFSAPSVSTSQPSVVFSLSTSPPLVVPLVPSSQPSSQLSVVPVSALVSTTLTPSVIASTVSAGEQKITQSTFMARMCLNLFFFSFFKI